MEMSVRGKTHLCPKHLQSRMLMQTTGPRSDLQMGLIIEMGLLMWKEIDTGHMRGSVWFPVGILR